MKNNELVKKINEELKLTESQENMIRQLNNLKPKGRKKLVEKMKMRELYQTKQLMALLGRIGLA